MGALSEKRLQGDYFLLKIGGNSSIPDLGELLEVQMAMTWSPGISIGSPWACPPIKTTVATIWTVKPTASAVDGMVSRPSQQGMSGVLLPIVPTRRCHVQIASRVR